MSETPEDRLIFNDLRRQLNEAWLSGRMECLSRINAQLFSMLNKCHRTTRRRRDRKQALVSACLSTGQFLLTGDVLLACERDHAFPVAIKTGTERDCKVH